MLLYCEKDIVDKIDIKTVNLLTKEFLKRSVSKLG